MMGFLTGFLLPCLYAVMACVAFCFILNQRGLLLVVSSLGGGVGWAVCLLCAFTGSDVIQYFAGAVAVALYAEVMARLLKAPATGFLVVGILPFVPGGGIYYTMEHAINGEIDAFLVSFLHTLGVAGAIAVGVLLVSSIVRMWQNIHHNRKELHS